MRKTAEPISYQSLAKLVLLLALLVNTGCGHSPPFQEYANARTALEAARRARASRHSPIFLTKASESYAAAEAQFKKDNFAEAKNLFEISREYSEKAEDQSRIKKWKMGDVD